MIIDLDSHLREQYFLDEIYKLESPYAQLPMAISEIGEERICLASDYPHHDFDAPDRVLPASQVGREFRAAVLAGNASRLIARTRLSTEAADGAR